MMPIFSRHGKERGVDKDLLFRIRNELEAKYSRPERGQEFLSREDALTILTRERVGDLFRPLAWCKEKYRNQIYPHMGVIICILITINFNRWNDFKTIFSSDNAEFLRPKLLDKDLPIDDVRVLPEFLRLDFERQQYTFFPIVIAKDSHKEYSGKYRWPIMKAESILGGGVQGDVDRVYIETGYLQYSSSFHNIKPKLMARKRITTETRRGQKFSSTERYNLEQFKNSLSNHGNIMQSFATFIHGSDFVILSDWADGRDLHHFLYHPDQVWVDYLQRSTRFTPHNLLSEVYALAEALDFLHYRMVNSSGGRYRCAHLDLKPENILVCIPDSGNPADAPVGRWKITDFGLSNVELSVARNELVRESPATANVGGLAPGTILGELSIQRRGKGPFQPPEVRDADTAMVSTRRDVWSYGCILAMVLAFALGGPDEVAHQHQLRSRGADDFFYERESSRNHANRPRLASGMGRVDARIKPEIVEWLDNRAPGIAAQHAPWVRLCSNLVLRLLEVDVVERPEMTQAVTDLEALLTHTISQGQYRMWEFDASSLAPEAVPVIPGLQGADDTESAVSPDPFVGLLPGSSSASTSEPQSPISSRSRSTISGIASWRPDQTTRGIRLQAVPSCRNSTICPTGLTAAFWNGDRAFVYNLSNIDDGNEIWQSSPSRSSVQLTDPSCPPMFQIRVTPGFEITRMVINGSFLAVLEYSRSRTYAIRIYSRDYQMDGQRFTFAKRHSMQIALPPNALKLSSLGSCLLRYSDRIQFITLGGSTDIPIGDADVMGFDFAGDGRAFCLWIRDGAYHHWTVRNTEGRILSPSMTYKCSNPGSRHLDREAFLIPFQSNARFIACDKHGSVFLVCADYGGERVQRLGHTENVIAGLMFPTDDAFLLIRTSEYSKQKLQRINLTSMSDRASFQPYDCGVMPKDVERNDPGICVRTQLGDESSTGICLLILRPSGLLIRKTFSSFGENMPSQGSINRSQTTLAAEDVVARFFTDRVEFVAMCEDILTNVSQEQFIRNLRRSLKKFYTDLRPKAESELELEAVALFQKRLARSRIASRIVKLIQPSQRIEYPIKTHAADINLMEKSQDLESRVLRSLPTESLSSNSYPGNPGDFNTSTIEVYNDSESESSPDGDLDIVSHQIAPNVLLAKDFLFAGQSFHSFLARIEGIASTSRGRPSQGMQEPQAKEEPQFATEAQRQWEAEELTAAPYLQEVTDLFSDQARSEEILGPEPMSTLDTVDNSNAQHGDQGEYRRVTWTCVCGVEMFDDYIELIPGSLDRLQEQLRNRSRPSDWPPRIVLWTIWSSLAGHRTPNTTIGIVSNSTTSSATTSSAQPNLSAGISIRPIGQTSPQAPQVTNTSANSAPHTVATICYLLLCLPTSLSSKYLHHMQLASSTTLPGVRDDVQFFHRLRQAYYSQKPPLYSKFSFKKVTRVILTRFLVNVAKIVDLRPHTSSCEPHASRCDCLPPTSLLEPPTTAEYQCSPVHPEHMPPIGHNYLTHCFERPEDAVGMTWALHQIPKRLAGQLMCMGGSKPAIGWGLAFDSGWDKDKVMFVYLIVVGLGTILFGVLYSVLDKAPGDAFTIAAYWVTLFGILAGCVGVAEGLPDVR